MRCRSAPRCRIRRARGDAARRQPMCARSNTWASPPARSWRACRWTGCSSAPAPTAGSRTCAPRRRSSAAARCASLRSSCRARAWSGSRPKPRDWTRCSARPASNGAYAGCSMCVGINGDLGRPGRAHRLDVQPQLRGAAGQGRAHAPHEPRDGGRRGGCRAASPTCASRDTEPWPRSSPRSPPSRRRTKACNVDTDQIIPARFLKVPRGEGYGRLLFHDLRFREDGTENPDFVLNRAPYRAARILVADANFGCGSSREAAAYAFHYQGVPQRHRAELRGHLLRQLPAERHRAGAAAARRLARGCAGS